MTITGLSFILRVLADIAPTPTEQQALKVGQITLKWFGRFETYQTEPSVAAELTQDEADIEALLVDLGATVTRDPVTKKVVSITPPVTPAHYAGQGGKSMYIP